VTWATATAINFLVLSIGEDGVAEVLERLVHPRGELLALSGQLGGGRVVERLSHRCLSVGPWPEAKLRITSRTATSRCPCAQGRIQG
jgi:hypothetical protein